ncbi:MAG: hypothetical protein E7161_03330 [Firmicutes bacterium]|nr:hypothetical protein [Bacillota bacterium]
MKKRNPKNIDVANDKVLVLLIGLLMVVSIILVVIWIFNSNNLKTNSQLVTELHNYFSSEDLGNCEGLFNYDLDKVEYKDIDVETRLCIAYQKADIKVVETETIKADKKKEICTIEDKMVFKTNDDSNECTISKVKKELIDNSYKKLYGRNIEHNESFKIDNLNICYLKDDYYYCGLSEIFTYTLGSESIIYRVMKKAEEKSSDIVIYDYFVKINEDVCYKYYTAASINQECTDNYKENSDIDYNFMKKYGTSYKHVYREAEDGTYYWVSSEPLSN